MNNPLHSNTPQKPQKREKKIQRTLAFFLLPNSLHINSTSPKCLDQSNSTKHKETGPDNTSDLTMSKEMRMILTNLPTHVYQSRDKAFLCSQILPKKKTHIQKGLGHSFYYQILPIQLNSTSPKCTHQSNSTQASPANPSDLTLSKQMRMILFF